MNDYKAALATDARAGVIAFMRMSVVLFCFGCLALSLGLVSIGGLHHPTKVQQQTASTIRSITTINPKLKGKADAHNDDTSLLIATSPAADSAALMKQILGALDSNNPGEQAMIFTNQLLALVKLDPWAAARLAESSEAGEWRTELMRVVVQNWAESDPWEAVKWINGLADSDARDTMLSCLCFHVADPGQAIQILEQEGLNDRREVMLGNLVQQWASQNLQGATAWADGYSPGNDRDNLFKQIVLAESQNAPSQAAETVVNDISPGPIQNEAAFLVLGQWAQQDLTGAAAWASQFPGGELYDQGQIILDGISKHERTKNVIELSLQTTQ
jgi:hypothetical protein